jgi:hypothetical protein
MLHRFALRWLYFDWMQMVKNNGSKSIAMLMGGFSNCLERAKMQVHELLSDELLDLQKFSTQIDERLKQKETELMN